MAWYDDIFGNFQDATLNAIKGDPLGDKAAADKQTAAAQAALEQQLAEAQRARDFMQQQSDQGLGYIQEGTSDAAQNLEAYGNAANQSLMGGYSSSLYNLGTHNRDAQLALAEGGIEAQRNLEGLTGLQGYAGGATNAINSYDVVGRQPSRLSDLANGGLAAGFEADPGYQFRQQQGEQAINRSAAARGGRLGGSTLKALADYNQNLASQEYGNYANRAIGMAQGADAQNMQALMNQAGRQDQAGLAAQQNQMALAGMGYGAQSSLADLAARQGEIGAGLQQAWGSQAADYTNQFGQNQANLYSGLGTNLANLFSGAGNSMANISIGAGTQNSALSQSMMGAYNSPVQYAGAGQAAQANTMKQGLSLLAMLYGGGAGAAAAGAA